MDAGVEATQERLPDVLSKSPAPAHGLSGQEPGKRQVGWPSLSVTYLLATQEISDSRAEGARKPLIYAASKRSARSWQHTLCANASFDTANQEHRARPKEVPCGQGALLQDRHLHHHARERDSPSEGGRKLLHCIALTTSKMQTDSQAPQQDKRCVILGRAKPWQAESIQQRREDTSQPSGRPFAKTSFTSTRFA